MAKLKLVFHDVTCINETTSIEQDVDIELSTEKETAEVIFPVAAPGATEATDPSDPQPETTTASLSLTKHLLSLVDLNVQKKMYQPTEIIADIHITVTDGADWEPVSRKILEDTFKHKRVSLVDVEVDSDEFDMGNDYYVHEVCPRMKSASQYVTLKIYSVDKLLTLREASRCFVGKILTDDILKKEMPKYLKPFSVDEKTTKYVDYETKNMKVLKYGDYEHIFPFLVQYNESFYDMLARTTNRWGEFMYYENGMLNIGYDATTVKQIKNTDYNTIYYFDLGSKTTEGATEGKYDNQAADEKDFLDKPLEKTPYSVSGKLGAFGDKADKYFMAKISQFFKNEKNIPMWLLNTIVDDLVDLAAAKTSYALMNNKFDDKYFKDSDVKHGTYTFKKNNENVSKDGFNLFAEINSKYTGSMYETILSKERAAAKNAILIDYDTTCPQLSLGNIISVNNEKFIVVEIKSEIKTEKKYYMQDGDIVEGKVSKLVFQVVATAQYKDDEQFYPAVIPSGHVRYADPQVATISFADDPAFLNRVRVKFPWQEDDIKTDDDAAELSTPWLTFTTNAAGTPVIGKHYADDKVLIGFVDGNVERPYVLGGLASKGSSFPGSLPQPTVIYKTPAGHTFRMDDGTGAGLTKFIGNAISPMYGTLSKFIPAVNVGDGVSFGLDAIKDLTGGKVDLTTDKLTHFEGGFTLCDYYGIYKISASTEDRNITINSPWGDVKMNAFTGITISAPNGDVKIQGKNVSIEAGNNLKLVSGKNVGYKVWKAKGEDKFTASSLVLQISTLVAQKLANTVFSMIDLSIVRSVVEIVMRPVEGALTVKSNRFLKLEAGKNACEYPRLAYNQERKLKMLNEEAGEKALSAIGSGANLSLDNGISTLIGTVESVAKDLMQRYLNRYNDCVAKKRRFNKEIENLKDWSNKPNEAVCKTFDELKNEFWKETDLKNAFDVSKLGFTDSVKLEGDNAVSADCHNRKAPGMHVNDNIVDTLIITIRKDHRGLVEEAARDLRKAICDLMSLEMTEAEVGKHFSWYWTTMPKDYKKKMLSALSKKNCAEAPIYKFSDNDKNLDAIKSHFLVGRSYKYMRRLIAMNILEELGFKDNMRKTVDDAVVVKPDVTENGSRGNTGILNDEHWRKYVLSLSGVPPIDKETSTLGASVRGAFTDALSSNIDAVRFFKAYDEMMSWGDGKEGRILFAADKETFELQNKTFHKVESLKPTFKGYSIEQLDDSDQKKAEAFMTKIRTALNKY